MKRIGLLLGILLVILSVSIPAFASWVGIMVVTNNTTTVYSMAGWINSTNVSYLVANGYINSTGNDTRVQYNSIDIPYMLATDKITFASGIGSNTNINVSFLTGQSQSDNFSIVLGNGGYITTNNTAAINSTNNYSITQGVYLSGTGNIFTKGSGYGATYNATSGNVTIYGSGGNFLDTTNDGSLTKNDAVYNTAWTAAVATSVAAGLVQTPIGQRLAGTYDIFRTFLYFDTSSVTGTVVSASLLVYKNNDSSDTDFNVVIQKGTTGHPSNPLSVNDFDKTFYSGNYSSFNTSGFVNGWNTIAITDTSFINVGSTTNFTLRSDRDINGIAPTANEYINISTAEVAGQEPTLVIQTVINTVTGVTNGYHIFTARADGTNTWATVDSLSSSNATAVTVNNTSNWVFGSSGTPYFRYIKMTIGGTEKVWYQPNSIITHNQLTDRDGTKNGDITWGTNPVSVAMTSFISTDIIVVNQADQDNQDVAPTITMRGVTLNPKTEPSPVNPLQPMIDMLASSYMYDVPPMIIWVIMMFVFAVIAFGITLGTFGHLGIAGVVGSAVVGLFTVLTPIPNMFLLLAIMGLIAGVVQEARG